MNDLINAYKKVKALRENRKLILIDCLDFGDFWGFAFCDVMPTESNPVGGVGFDTVDKTTGKIGFFVPTSNLELFDKATVIPLSKLEGA